VDHHGSKSFITNSGTELTKLITVTAVTREVIGQESISSILVEVPSRGLRVDPAYDKVGWHASDTHLCHLKTWSCPRRTSWANEDEVIAIFFKFLTKDVSQLLVGGRSGARLRGREHQICSRERSVWPRNHQNQAIAFKIADMEARVHAARCTYYDAAARMLSGRPFKKERRLQNWSRSNAAMDNARDATQIHGGFGFMNECLVARHYRDSKILEIGEGRVKFKGW